MLENKLNDTSKNNHSDLEYGTFYKTIGLVSSKGYYCGKKIVGDYSVIKVIRERQKHNSILYIY